MPLFGTRAEARRVKFIARVAVTAIAGAVIAWVVMAFILDAMFAAGGYTSDALVEPSPWTVCAVGGCGALVAWSVALLCGKSRLPSWVQPIVLGSLSGVATVVTATLFVAYALGGPTSKGQSPYLHAGLIYGVPVGLVVGAVRGLAVAKRRRAALGAANRLRE
jgi:hypothetical protein